MQKTAFMCFLKICSKIEPEVPRKHSNGTIILNKFSADGHKHTRVAFYISGFGNHSVAGCCTELENLSFVNEFKRTVVPPSIYGSPNTLFLENALKKTAGILSQISCLFESTILPVNNGK